MESEKNIGVRAESGRLSRPERIELNRLIRNDTDGPFEIQKKLSLSKEMVEKEVKRAMINELIVDDIGAALKIKEKFSLSAEVIRSPEVQAAAKEMIIKKLKRGDINVALKIKEEFSLPAEMMEAAAQEAMIYRLKEGFISDALEIKEKFSLSAEVIRSPEVAAAAKALTIDWLRRGFISDALEIKEKFSLSAEVIRSPEVQAAAKAGVIELSTKESITIPLEIRDKLSLSAEVIRSPEVQAAAKEMIIKKLKRGDINVALKIKEEFSLPAEMMEAAAKEVMIGKLKEGNIDIAFNIKEWFPLSAEVVKAAAQEAMIYRLKEGFINRALEIKEKFSLPKEVVEAAAKAGMIKLLTQGGIYNAVETKEKFSLSAEVIRSPEVAAAAKAVMIKLLTEGSIDDAVKIQKEFSLSLDKTEEKIVGDAVVFSTSPVTFFDSIDTKLDNYTEEELQGMWADVQKFPAWKDRQTIAKPFQTAAETFGYKRMLEYIKRKDLDLHDAVHAFPAVLELYKASSLGASEFYGQILQQVHMDDREYLEGTAHDHLNAIAQTANKNVAEVMAKVQKYTEIEKLQELAETFNTPQAVFASWVNLKRYSELEQLLGQTEILDELKVLQVEGKEKLYRYVETLAFHPDSKVDMLAVMQFWRDPDSFLAAEASHTPPEVHDRKKPSNYLTMPNLDLTASELIGALVEGDMDGLSAFTPLEIRYTIPLEDVKSEPLPDLVNKALGSSKKGAEGAARNSRKLFSELSKLLKPHGVSVAEYIQGKSMPEVVNLSQEIEALIYHRNFGMERPPIKTREFVARISPKSDPEGAVAGDDTVNCMPFGDGKNTVYTFNPNTAQFVIRVVKDDGKERTIAQSVLTKDMDIKTPIPDVISKLQQEGGHLEDILPADILITAPVYVACDNVEVAPNYSDERHQHIIEAIFRDFFREYMSRYAKAEGLNSKKVPIGQGYTDALSQLPIAPNTFAPQAPVSYSDKTGPNVYMLDLESDAGMDLILLKQMRETKLQRKTEPPLPQLKGLGYLTFEDSLKVAYLEGKAYADNQSLMQFLFNMENALIAKDINNAAKGRPNMSLKYADEKGQMRGYMLAWEGRLSDENVEYNAGEFFNQPCVYIMDIATERENRMAGGRLIQGFAELYKQNYLDKGNPMPIFAQAREATSYEIIKKQLDKLGQDTGFNFELIELPTYEVGEDIMHPIIIRPVSKKA